MFDLDEQVILPEYVPAEYDEKPFFPPVIDSTILASFRSCPRKMMMQYMQHWKPRSESVHLVAGKAFASGLEAARRAYYQEGDSLESAMQKGHLALLREYGTFQCPEGSPKTLERMSGALQFYFERYPLDTDHAKPANISGRSGIEFSFAEQLPIMHPQTGQPLLYVGRADMIVDFCGALYLEDDKTTTQLGASWSRQWELRSQFQGYTWAARRAGIPIAGTIVRGISILKTKYDTLEAIPQYSTWEIERWEKQMLRDVQRMIACWQDGYFDFSLDNACSEYGGCIFQSTCKSPTPEQILELYFEQRVWDPVQRMEITPDQFEARWGHSR